MASSPRAPPSPPGRRRRARGSARASAGGGDAPGAAATPAGQEAAGEVVGSGERVMGRCPGGFAEFGLMDKTDAIPVPPNLSWEEAGAIPLTFMVVHDMLVTGVSAGVGVA